MTTDLLNNLRNSSPNEGSHDLCCRCLDAAKEIAALREQAARTERMKKITDAAAQIITNVAKVPMPLIVSDGSETFTFKPKAHKFSSDVLAETVQKYEAELAAVKMERDAVRGMFDEVKKILGEK